MVLRYHTAIWNLQNKHNSGSNRSEFDFCPWKLYPASHNFFQTALAKTLGVMRRYHLPISQPVIWNQWKIYMLPTIVTQLGSPIVVLKKLLLSRSYIANILIKKSDFLKFMIIRFRLRLIYIYISEIFSVYRVDESDMWLHL